MISKAFEVHNAITWLVSWSLSQFDMHQLIFIYHVNIILPSLTEKLTVLLCTFAVSCLIKNISSSTFIVNLSYRGVLESQAQVLQYSVFIIVCRLLSVDLNVRLSFPSIRIVVSCICRSLHILLLAAAKHLLRSWCSM